MRTVEVGGLRIAYRRVGSGPPLVLLHGGLTDSRDWTRQLDPFAEEFTVIAWDAPGHGGSDDLPEGYGLPDCADTLAGFAHALGLDRPHIVGLSFGGILAIALHERYPGLARSYVLASAYAGWRGSLPAEEVERRIASALRDVDRPPADVAREFVATLLPPGSPAALVEEQEAMVRESRPATTRVMLTRFAPVDLRHVLPMIDVPTLLLYGDADVRSPAPVADALHRAIPGSVLAWLPGVGHCGHLQQPERWNEEVLRFLRACPRDPGGGLMACSVVARSPL